MRSIKLFCCSFLVTLTLFACAQNSQPVKVSPEKFQELIKLNDVQILDVRTMEEFKAGHLAGALQANWLNKIEFDSRTAHMDLSKPVYVYCQVGGRSAAAQAYLKGKGFQVINMEGGLTQWKMKGLPVEGAGELPQMRFQDFEKILNENEYVLVDVTAAWCPPCRKMAPIVSQLQKNPPVNFYLLTVEGGQDIDVMKSIQAEELPTFIIYKNKKEIWRHVGIVEKSVLMKAFQ